jgi:hypothetical protein
MTTASVTCAEDREQMAGDMTLSPLRPVAEGRGYSMPEVRGSCQKSSDRPFVSGRNSMVQTTLIRVKMNGYHRPA